MDQDSALEWTGKGRVQAAMSGDSLHLRVDALTSQSKRFKTLIGEFFRTEFKRVRPKYGPYEVEIRIERTENSPVHDVDNVAKAVLDALTGCVFHDDSQVEKLMVEKVLSDRARVRVKARPLNREAA
ncbi:RusA family crossover junction endodeoxyribonuclease [Hyphobacterium indicum]|jgi:crossover junction endodeoxyribonuclease RusA|uniref:RusA family crossover junction endodeoxyribonuclease n=1 Tax=Hyphobacterium indicum TaxID=2162714 RepID=UPI001F2DD91E|nr:RusA family crossover junction endodeoxyribonuclease [Hyphobacterium indicum]